MAAFQFEVPDEVVSAPVDVDLDLTGWDGTGVPVALVLRWIERSPVAPWSVALLESIDPQEVAPGDRAVYVAAWERIEAHAAAGKARAISLLAGAEPQANTWESVDPAPHEVSMALRVPLRAAQTEVAHARRLHTHLPVTRALFADGVISARHVRALLSATRELDTAACAAVEERVLAGVGSLSVHELARRLRRAVARLHPQPLAERHSRAAAGAEVSVQHADDAMSLLTAWMPSVDAALISTAVDAYARGAKASGDPQPLGALRARALRLFAEAYLTGSSTGPAPTGHGRPVEIQICATPEALLALTDTPAEIPGVGPVPVQTVRDMAADARLRWLTIDPDCGRVLDYGDRTYRVPTALAHHAAATYVISVGPHSTVPAARTDLDHATRYPDGPTSTTNTVPIDRGWHRAKTFARFALRRHPDGTVTWTSPLGQTTTVHPYDYRLGP